MTEPPKLSVDEQLRRLEVMLKAKLITQEQYDKRAAAVKAPPAPAPPASAEARRGPPPRGRSVLPGRPREDHSDLATAPYRFVTVPSIIVPAEKDATSPLHEVKRAGFCAEIAVTFEAETPLLIGTEGEGNQVVPMTLDGAAGYVIPGATLRGAIRAAAEIVAFGRLTQVNENHAFGLRDFDHAAYGEGAFPVGRVGDVEAAWLRRIGKDDDGEATYAIAPCDWWAIEADRLVGSRHLAGSFADGKAFTRKSLREKYEAAGYATRGEERNTFVLDFAPKTFRLVEEINGKPAVAPADGGSIRGVLVFSGRSPSGKRLEYVMTPPPDDPGIPLDPPVARLFERMHGTMVKDTFRPDGSLADLMPTLEAGKPIPVFFVGDPHAQDPRRFAVGLTRLFKVPHASTVGDIVGIRLPKLGDGGLEPDLVENLFGYVYEPNQFPKTKGLKDGEVPPGLLARKGRVGFSFARLANPDDVALSAPVETVMMGARASFAPFYLRGRTKDYSDAMARIAGRKRYLPRFPAARSDGALDTAADKIKELLRRQVDVLRASGAQVNDKVTTRLVFLQAKPGRTMQFESRIRLFNVTAVELGAVLWTLTFGGEPEKYRHMIGRAKPFGAGQARVAKATLDVEANVSPSDLITPIGGAGPLAACADADHTPFLQAFEAYMTTQVPGWRSTPTLTDFLKASDPAVGAALAAKGKLGYLPLKVDVGGRSENPYKLLRDMTKPRKDGVAPIGRERFLDFE
ncbi:hypothetical protein A33M_1551 [Rhodovulum sp. PH10]|uniref:TIGR03986 family type III CRISPR-associated RAMP protein n=1 Tax=Rhodovulum sp. PH10 TaxID=1187851 RepID=UPI00027C2120|nr:TIGR03986 family CRISPR-associated RAMP protein [Rhodovulum sp. PH10]EJW09341.1 hypothetical protein A33M_1551 [Rhodovulum sp. PH10]